jgi:hypothetical protein
VNVGVNLGKQLGKDSGGASLSGAGFGQTDSSANSATVAAISGIAGNTAARTGNADTGVIPPISKVRKSTVMQPWGLADGRANHGQRIREYMQQFVDKLPGQHTGAMAQAADAGNGALAAAFAKPTSDVSNSGTQDVNMRAAASDEAVHPIPLPHPYQQLT